MSLSQLESGRCGPLSPTYHRVHQEGSVCREIGAERMKTGQVDLKECRKKEKKKEKENHKRPDNTTGQDLV